MEVVMKKAAFKEEIKDVELMGDEDNGEVPPTISRERSPMDNSIKPSPADTKVNSITQLDRLEMTKAEMGEVREENERLKMILARIVKDYQSLHVQFLDIFQQDQAKKLPNDTSTNLDDHIEDQELVSLSLGTSSSGQKKEDKLISVSKNKEYDEPNGGGLTLGLECKFEGSSGDKHEVPMTNVSSDNSFEEAKEVEAGEPWPPSKIFKNIRSGEDEVLQQPQVKKARVSVRARCDAPTMSDGCQWRKYGQKIAKGNPCPRAYYRCTVAPGCPVRKQVQRCAQDTSILITTYEGTHNHPLPISATAMASTTSAAASMLMSGSSASSPAIGSHTAASAAATTTLNGLKFSLADPSKTNQLIYFPTPSLSSAASHPTITLDLTAPSSSSSSSASQPSFFSTFSSNPNPRFSPTGFNFSTSETGSTTATLPPSWTSGYLSYASPLHIKSPIGCLNLGSKAQDLSYQSCMQKIANPSAASPGQNSLTDTIAKAITADPSFRSALATAITSYVGAQGGPGDGRAQGLKWGDQLGSGGPIGGSGCASSYLTNSGSPASKPGQHGSLLLPQPTLGFASSKSSTSASAFPVENMKNIN
ncbi:probable WRKY transcription factor 72 isoform X2 [Ananas comosus]|uniref:Probable WRKY transcription factor 72 isoform X2 n=1 Tax=Ananas comosus TaxID=4615 RepID=A0A6P5FY52_ANACO|nr:probable WRKY transcription factor 72 isoform X2 [Ananas comosus]